MLAFRKKWVSRSAWLIWGVALVMFLGLKASAAEKKILLRNETIVTSGLARQSLRAEAAPSPGRRLYLLQLVDDPPPDWKQQLEALKVDLLRPVPQDAYVVELEGSDLARIETLPFVQWVGPYRPEHKALPILDRLAAESQALQITAVLSPKASTLETALLQRQFQLLRRYTRNRFGRVLEGQISPLGFNHLKESKAVLWIEPAPKPKLYDAVADVIIGGEGTDNGVAVQQLGFDGKGVVVGVADSGLNLGEGQPMHPDLE